jgi:hypothetical protein
VLEDAHGVGEIRTRAFIGAVEDGQPVRCIHAGTSASRTISIAAD